MAGDEGHNIPCITTKDMASKQSKTAELVINQLSLVKPIAAHYARSTGQDQDDLIQVGRLGLIRASKLFIESEGNPFTTSLVFIFVARYSTIYGITVAL